MLPQKSLFFVSFLTDFFHSVNIHSQFEHAILIALHFPQGLVHKCDGRIRWFLQLSKGLIKRSRVGDVCPCGLLHRSDSALKYASSFVQKVKALN